MMNLHWVYLLSKMSSRISKRHFLLDSWVRTPTRSVVAILRPQLLTSNELFLWHFLRSSKTPRKTTVMCNEAIWKEWKCYSKWTTSTPQEEVSDRRQPKNFRCDLLQLLQSGRTLNHATSLGCPIEEKRHALHEYLKSPESIIHFNNYFCITLRDTSSWIPELT